jgi:hypothetical protein
MRIYRKRELKNSLHFRIRRSVMLTPVLRLTST